MHVSNYSKSWVVLVDLNVHVPSDFHSFCTSSMGFCRRCGEIVVGPKIVNVVEDLSVSVSISVASLPSPDPSPDPVVRWNPGNKQPNSQVL